MKAPPPAPGLFATRRFVLAVTITLLMGFGLGWESRPKGKVEMPADPRIVPLGAIPSTPVVTVESLKSFDEEASDQLRVPYQHRWRLAEAAAGLNEAELGAALEREQRRLVETHSADDRPAEALLARYAELNPPKAAAWLTGVYENSRLEHASWMDAVLSAWTAHDAAAAVAWVQGLTSPTLRASGQTELPNLLAVHDPELALRQVVATGAEQSAVTTLFYQMADQDLAFAQAHVLNLPTGAVIPALEGMINRWAGEGDPKAVYAWAAQILSSPARAAALNAVYQSWGERDPAGAAQWMLAHGGSDLAGNSVSGLAMNWAMRDPAGALAWAGQLPVNVRENALNGVLIMWQTVDARAEAQYLAAQPGDKGDNQLTEAVQQWAKSSEEGARAWVESLPPGPSRKVALLGISKALYSDDPRAAVEYLGQRPEGAGFKDQIEAFVAGWAESEPEQVWQYSQTLTDGQASEEAKSAALGQMTTTDPARATSLFTQLSSEEQEKAVGGMIQKWSNREPEAAAQWAANLPDGKIRSEGWSNLVSRWVSDDAPATAAWLQAQPACEAKDDGIGQVLQNGVGDMAPKDAIRLARSIGSTDKRGDALVSVATNWLKQDGPAATAWIKKSRDLTTDQRTSLLAPPEETQPDSQ